jgi:hypothetical protein
VGFGIELHNEISVPELCRIELFEEVFMTEQTKVALHTVLYCSNPWTYSLLRISMRIAE